jgi:hypothetical protein
MLRKLLLVSLLISSVPLFSADITLNKKWVQKHMNQVTTSITMDVRDVKDAPNNPFNDGDIHMGGKSPEAGLPLVAEIMNAGLKPQKQALEFAQKHSGKSIHVTGVWRLWFEHPPSGKGSQVQKINGNIRLTKPAHVTRWTNPDHFFEVHPITEFADDGGVQLDLPDSIHFVDGIKKYDPKDVFPFYEQQEVEISETAGAKGTITIDSKKSKYNYVVFLVRFHGSATQTSSHDGYLLFGEICDWKGKQIELNCQEEQTCVRRMIVANDTQPFQVFNLAPAKNMQGKCFKVLGIPRINLERVNYILKNPEEFADGPVYLPYEMILVGAEPSPLCKSSDE